MAASNWKPYYPVTGRSDTGVIAPRLSIEELQRDDKQFTLFILSYLIIQDRGGVVREVVPVPPGTAAGVGSEPGGPIPIPPGSGIDAAKFFNIAAIHGKPYQRWLGDHEVLRSDYDSNDKKDTDPVPSRFGGYCNHGSVLFPTWHRPYIMLIEQVIGTEATALAQQLDALESNPNSTKWQEAAKKLRFPYWDWADPRVEKEGMPSILYEEEISLNVSSMAIVKVPNPLALFPINVIPPDFTDEVNDEKVKSYFTAWKTTLRHPASDANAKKSNIEELQKQLKSRARDLRYKVAALFTFGYYGDSARIWDEFSNHSPSSFNKEAKTGYRGSLEGVHDVVHDIIGGLGHMGHADYAGFDPIFYLHHCNVDRLYALWEYCYQPEDGGNGYWMGNGYEHAKIRGKIVPWKQPAGTYSEIYNAQLLPESPLTPFRTHNGRYWSSDEARYLTKNLTQKYYTYHILGFNVEEDDSLGRRRRARFVVQRYYKYDPRPLVKRGIFVDIPKEIPSGFEVVKDHRQFVVVVKLLEHAYNGPYSFKLYTDGETGCEIVGQVSVFARPDHSPCAACAGHRADSSVIMGAIFIDEKRVNDAIARVSNHDTDIAGVVAGLKGLFHAELASPAGISLGIARPSVPEKGVDHSFDSHLPLILAPISVTLMSAAAIRPKNIQRDEGDLDGEGPISWMDWIDHGDVFVGGHHAWKKPENA